MVTASVIFVLHCAGTAVGGDAPAQLPPACNIANATAAILRAQQVFNQANAQCESNFAACKTDGSGADAGGMCDFKCIDEGKALFSACSDAKGLFCSEQCVSCGGKAQAPDTLAPR